MTISGAHTYLSSSEIMEWMVEHNGRINDNLQLAMDKSESRADITKALSELKDQLQQSKGIDGCYEARAVKIDEFLALYGNDPTYGKELTDTLQPIATAYHNGQTTYNDSKGGLGIPPEEIDGHITTLQGEIDKLNKEDQLAMIQINDYSSHINQGQQLASNLISAMNQTAMALVNNIK